MTIDLLLVNDDPVFQLGLSTALAADPELQPIARVEGKDALASLPQRTSTHPWVAIVEWAVPPDPATLRSRLQQCQQLKQAAPDLKILLLSSPLDPSALGQVQNAGIEGYCPKGSNIDTVIEAIRQIAAGNGYWSTLPARSTSPSRPLPTWLYLTCQDGIAQIEANLDRIKAQLENEQLPWLDWFFWTGRARELRVARWLIHQMSPEAVILPPEPPPSQETEEGTGEIELVQSQSLVPASQSLFDRAIARLELGAKNGTGTPLALDILQPEKKRELLYVVLRQIQNVIADLRGLGISPEELPGRRSPILQQIWERSTVDFVRPYYSPGETLFSPLAEFFVQEVAAIQRMTLDKIPFMVDLFAYLVYSNPIEIDNVPYRSDSPEAQARAELLLDNLTLQLANSVLQLLLNCLTEEANIKYGLYDRLYLSSREIARLRNELSWQYRKDYYFEEPKAIFESRYRLLVFKGSRIEKTTIASPRLAELNQLQGIRWFATIILETRDAIAPRVKALVSLVGQGLVYLLTQVLGKGIGLIARGTIQGFGNALQETRYNKNTK